MSKRPSLHQRLWRAWRPQPAWLVAVAESAEADLLRPGSPWGETPTDALRDKSWLDAWRHLLRALVGRLAHDVGLALANWPLLALTGLPAGILVYFALPSEPPVWLGPLAVLASLLGFAWVQRWRQTKLRAISTDRQGGALWASLAALVVAGLVMASLGLAAASLRTVWMATPSLERPIFAKTVTGRVLRSEAEADAWRIWLAPQTVEGWREESPLPRILRLRLAAGEGIAPAMLQVGAELRGRVQAFPPAAPVRPGGLDIQRLAFFQGIGGYGRFMDVPELLQAAPSAGPSAWIELARERLASHLRQRFSGDLGQAMAALVVGTSQGISEATKEAIRKSGLAHLFAISGLHMGIVAGFAFFCFRFALLGLGGLGLHLHAKKVAALLSLLVGAGYLAISGAAIPAQRAFLMLSLVLAAVAFDRQAFSPRLVGWAALAILLLRPDSLLTPSFQMSFAAVAALIAFAPFWQRWLNQSFFSAEGQERASWQVFAAKAAGLMATSAIATFATAPFVLATFHRLAMAGLVANLLAVPLTGLWILPWGMLGLALSPLGLGDLGFVPMSWGVALLLDWARWISALDLGLIYLPSFAGAWTALTGLALWLALLTRGSLRLLASGLLILSFLGPMTGERAAAFIAPNARSVAISSPEGLILYRARAGSFVADQWAQAQGWQPTLSLKQAEAQGLLRCDDLACVTSGAQPIAISQDFESLIEDCQAASLVISLGASMGGCAVPLIDYQRIKQGGAVSVYRKGSQWRLYAVRAWQGQRPWSRWPDQEPGEKPSEKPGEKPDE